MRVALFCIVILFMSCQQRDSNQKGNNQYSNLFSISTPKNEFSISTFDEQGEEISKVEGVTANGFNNVVLLNTTYWSYCKGIDARDKVVGIVDKDRIMKEDSSHLMKVKSVGKGGVLDLEQILFLKPDLIICNSFQKNELKGIKNCPVLVVNEFWENDPLGKLEWIKVFGVLTGKYEEAEKYFDKVSNQYTSLLNSFKKGNPSELTVKSKSVLSLNKFGSNYFVPGCNALINKLILDAQGSAICLSDKAKSEEISFEQVVGMCGKAKFVFFQDWSAKDRSKEEVLVELGINKVYSGQVIYCNTQSTHYFEKSILEPDVVLREFSELLTGRVSTTSYFSLLEE